MYLIMRLGQVSTLRGVDHSVLNLGAWEYLHLAQSSPNKEWSTFTFSPSVAFKTSKFFHFDEKAAPRGNAAKDAPSLPFSVPSAQLVCDESLVRSLFYCTHG